MNHADYLRKWIYCEACNLHEHRRNTVLGEGDVPCDVLFLGDAPNKVEDVTGRPFYGKAGHLLRFAISLAAVIAEKKPKIFYANVVACRPCSSFKTKNITPTKAQAMACQPRLFDCLRMTTPRVVVCLGNTADRYMNKLRRSDTFKDSFGQGAADLPEPMFKKLIHPNYIVRNGGERHPMFDEFKMDISEIFRNV